MADTQFTVHAGRRRPSPRRLLVIPRALSDLESESRQSNGRWLHRIEAPVVFARKHDARRADSSEQQCLRPDSYTRNLSVIKCLVVQDKLYAMYGTYSMCNISRKKKFLTAIWNVLFLFVGRSLVRACEPVLSSRISGVTSANSQHCIKTKRGE